MNSPRGRRPGKRATREQLAALSSPSAPALLEQIKHWLEAIEAIRNIWKDAPKREFTRTGCNGDGGNHNWHVRLVPKPPHRTNRIICTTPLVVFPPTVLMKMIVLPLRAEGFEVTDPSPQRCGCATFTVLPKRLAE